MRKRIYTLIAAAWLFCCLLILACALYVAIRFWMRIEMLFAVHMTTISIYMFAGAHLTKASYWNGEAERTLKELRQARRLK